MNQNNRRLKTLTKVGVLFKLQASCLVFEGSVINYLVLAGYQPAWVMWYIALIPQALVLCLIYIYICMCPQACGPRAFAYISGKSTRACGISITYTMMHSIVAGKGNCMYV